MSDDYRNAKAAVPRHLRIQSDAELARRDWLMEHRGIPHHELYDRMTGQPIHPRLAQLERAIDKAVADVAWCRALVVAAAEEAKGEPFDVVVSRNEAHRHKVGSHL